MSSYLLSALFLFVGVARAQDTSYLWTFNEFDLLSRSEISSCRTLTLNLTAMLSSFPPTSSSSSERGYYMIATELDGLPQTTFLGFENDAESGGMEWNVNHAPGSQVVLRVVDSDGNSGGTGPAYTISASDSSSDCLPDTPSSSFTISTNATDKLTTCDPWGIRLHGGTPPYTINLVAPNSPVTTNVTTVGEDDAYTYVNRAAPNDLLIVAASDSTGMWASGTPHVRTQGSTEVECNGMQSSSGQSSVLDAASSTSSNAAPIETSSSPSSDSNDDGGGSNKAAIIAGVVVPVVALLLLGLGAWWLIRRRKQRVQQEEQDMSIRPYGSEGGEEIKSEGGDPFSPVSLYGHSSEAGAITIGSHTGKLSSPERRLPRVPVPVPFSPTSDSSSSSGRTEEPLRIIPPTKAQQAGFHNVAPLTSTEESSSQHHAAQSPTAQTDQTHTTPTELTRRPSQQQEVFQHTDVTDTEMLELPPPYVGDRPPIHM